MTTIAFVGLGHMGTPMVKNLLKAGFSVTVFDLSKSAMEALKEFGATQAVSLADAAKNADVIITMLQTGEQVKQVCLGDEGLFAHAKKNVLYIDSSSIDIATTHFLHAECEKRGIAMLDAPVSGGVGGASAATLTMMVGGDEKNAARGKSIFEKLGKKIVYAGAAGSGQAAKICNNLMLAISMIAVSEGFTLGQKLGLDPKKLFEIGSNSSSQCWSMTSYCPVPDVIESVPSNNQYKAGFTANMMLKDLRLAKAAAESHHAVLPLGDGALELYSHFVEQGNGEMDFSGIIKMMQE